MEDSSGGATSTGRQDDKRIAGKLCDKTLGTQETTCDDVMVVGRILNIISSLSGDFDTLRYILCIVILF